jgi:hypothetical protein
MSDMMEIETGDEMVARIAAVGSAVATAAERLKRAAERFLGVRERFEGAEDEACVVAPQRATTGMAPLFRPADAHGRKALGGERPQGEASLGVFLPV